MRQILIIDDEAEVIATLKSHLELRGLSVDTAPSAQDALVLHEENLYPIILTDIRMPGMSGVELIRDVKRLHPTCIVFVMTGYTTLANLVECLELGACDYFTKPFESMDFVLDSVEDALKRHERWKQDIMRKRKQVA